jgi:hypothetical protein
VVSLWNELATNMGQELLDAANSSPIVAIKSLKVGDFQGKANFKLKIIVKCSLYAVPMCNVLLVCCFRHIFVDNKQKHSSCKS